jgi:hypothetical protein
MVRWGSGFCLATFLAVLPAVLLPQAGAQAPAPAFRKRVIAFGVGSGSAVAADFNGDGRLDVAAAGEEEVAWFERGSGRSFWARRLIHARTPVTGSVWSAWLVAHDVDGDGDLDLLSHTLANGNLAWYENPGPASAPEGWKWRLIDNLPGVRFQALEDLNRDGRPELVAVHEGAIVWYLIPADTRAALPANYTGEAAGRPRWERRPLARAGTSGELHSLSFADLDGDGDRDAAAGAARGGFLAWWERPADGTLLWSRRLIRDGLPGATHCIPVDLNGDGKLDLLYSLGHARGIGWLAGPEWRGVRIIDPGWLEGPHAVAVGDIDGDGHPDIAAAGRDNSRIAWFRNDGRGSFARLPIDEDQIGNDVRLVDLDGDGDLDLLVAGAGSRNTVWYENLRL